MTNELILFIEIIITFTLLLLINKVFGKTGVIAWTCIASILANIITAKNAIFFTFPAAIGSVMFASIFLATDILTECYSFKDAKIAIGISISATIIFIIISQISLLYIPSQNDYAHEAMLTLFNLNLRISISSVVMYALSNMLDIYIFQKLKIKTHNRMLWLRNNISTIICNCLENFLFMFFAFINIYDLNTIIAMAIGTSVIEIIIAICDTPFLYLARKFHYNPKLEENNNGTNKI